LEKFGFDVVHMRDHYPNGGQDTEDVEWIRDSAAHGYIAITCNPYLIGVPHEKEAILATGAKVFSISKANHTRDGRALIFGRHLLRIKRRARVDGGCF
jgi:D-serine deaminase-like pyridoxal phosphate-dependent protein